MRPQFSLLHLLLFGLFNVVLVRAQPQYRVTVTPVAMVANVIGEFNITLCFREANSPSATSPSHCPLGMTTVPANTVFPDVTLELGDGSDNLPGPYPLISPGIGVFLRVEVVDSKVNGTSASITNNTILQTPGDPGTDIEITMLPIEGGGVYSVRYRVDCIDGFIGVDCNESPATTSDAASVTQSPSTSTRSETSSEGTSHSTDQVTSNSTDYSTEVSSQVLTTRTAADKFLSFPEDTTAILVGVGIGAVGASLATMLLCSLIICCCVCGRDKKHKHSLEHYYADTGGTVPLSQSNNIALQKDVSSSPRQVLTYDRAGNFSTFAEDKRPTSVHYDEVNNIKRHSADSVHPPNATILPPEVHDNLETSDECDYISPESVAVPQPKSTEASTNAASMQYIVVLNSNSDTVADSSFDISYVSRPKHDSDMAISSNASMRRDEMEYGYASISAQHS